MRSSQRIGIILLCILVAVISGFVGAYIGGSMVAKDVQTVLTQAAVPEEAVPEVTPQVVNTSITIASSEIDTVITDVVQNIEPAVVTVVGTIPGSQTFFGRTADSQVSGSGFIVSQDGYIITNNHVIEDAISLYVILSDGTELDADLISRDIYADLAVLKVDGTMPAVAPLGDSEDLKPGETVIAIGSPLGTFQIGRAHV